MFGLKLLRPLRWGYGVTFPVPTLKLRHNRRDGVKTPASPVFTQPFIWAQTEENMKAPRHLPLCREPVDRWIPRTNGQ